MTLGSRREGRRAVSIDRGERGTDKPKPDLLVRFGGVTNKNYVTDRLVVVEVLSPSTMDVDRGGKMPFYKRLPTLTHLVMVYEDQCRVEHHRRVESGWELEVLKRVQDLLAFQAFDFAISLDDIYNAIDVTA